MLPTPFCPYCEKQLPEHFLWSAGLHSRSCPHCDKDIRLKRSVSFIIGMIALTLVPIIAGQILARYPLADALIISVSLIGGVVLVGTPRAGGLAEESNTASSGL